jgi:hypothetical protein
LWIFCSGAIGAHYAKNPDYRGCCGPRSDSSLQGIKIHIREFLYDFALKRNKLPGDWGSLYGKDMPLFNGKDY